ncbi:T9SS type A sorting domain-containing protein [Dyadobacter sp. Leaf189]|uniref:T9SS type A sorting domain-containing protein n=1 Tax=Dyadobacter sp. Leaf189 TaxID=1736295 RepID=UPI0006FB160F|nr:T9SS type A sorting domain-containing protein [Dyadobacter sp. Leaf189]KQS24747.1 hypothetical protein ASG33_23625 [Dyadobacter sp. Leaf189]
MRGLFAIWLTLFALAGCNKPDMEPDLAVVTYPNPATSVITVYVQNDQQQAYIIRIFGPDAKQVAEQEVGAGIQRTGIKFDLEGKSKGTYQVVVEIGGITLVRTFYKV